MDNLMWFVLDFCDEFNYGGRNNFKKINFLFLFIDICKIISDYFLQSCSVAQR